MEKLTHFFGKESSNDALRNILLITIPGTILFFTVSLQFAIAFSVGVILSCLTDLPGNKQDKWTAAKWCIPLFLITSLSISYFLSLQSWVVVLLLGVFGFVYTMIVLLGLRISFIGNLSLIVASFTIGLRPENPFVFTAGITLGCIFFFSVVIIQVYISPYRSLRYAIDEAIENIAQLIRLKIDCYDENVSLNKTYKDLSVLQVKVSDQLEAVRSLLLREKELVSSDSTATKVWLTKLYHLVDLYELLMAIDADYETTRHLLKDTNTLPLIRIALENLANETQSLRLSGKNNASIPKKKEELNALLKQLQEIEKSHIGETKELIHSVAQHLEHISNILAVIKSDEIVENSSWIENKKYADFAPKNINISSLFKNLNFKSTIFIYAVRMSLLLISAGLIGYILPEYRYASWIMLTIILVARPTYSITQKRNYQRIVGSTIGICISLVLLYFIHNTLVLFSIAVICLYLYLLFTKPNYLVCVIFITISVLLFLKIYEGGTSILLSSRFIFTLLGSLLAVIGCLAIPINHYKTIEKSTNALIQNFKLYLEKIESNLYSNEINFYDLRLTRKFTQNSLSSSYDTLEHFTKEPIIGKQYIQEINHLQSLTYRINALLVGLTVNITKFKSQKQQSFLAERIHIISDLIVESEMLSTKLAKRKK